MSVIVRKRNIYWFIAAFFLLLLSYILLFTSGGRMKHQAQLVEHTDSVITNIRTLKAGLFLPATNYRMYIISGNGQFLPEFEKEVSKNKSLLDKLYLLLEDNSAQIALLDNIKPVILGRDRVYKRIIDSLGKNLPEEGKKMPLLVKGIENDSLFYLVAQLDKMKDVEMDLLRGRTVAFKRFSNIVSVINIFTISLVFLITLLAAIGYNKENEESYKARVKNEEYRKQLEDRVKELNIVNRELNELKALEKFTATGRIARTIAHEVRNPLTNINLATEQMRDITNDEDAVMMLDMISRNSSRINNLVSDLLNATKFSELHFQKTAINELLDEALKEVQDRIEWQNIRIVKNYHDVCAINADAGKLKIAFTNLILNAVEAMENRQDSTLTITTESVNDKCVVEIQDNGCGLGQQALQRIFEPFYTSKEKGHGLGLTNSQNIIFNHKGTLNVVSEEGKGTKFTIVMNMA